MQYKRIFISGGAGVIGTALVERLLSSGAILLVGDLKPCPPAWKGKLRYRQGDLNEITVSELNDFSPDFFFHLAATFERTQESPSFFQENYHHNIALTHHLLELMQSLPCLKKIVFASSYLIYDPNLYCFPNPQKKAVLLNEGMPTSPRNLCGMSKLYNEKELQFLKSHTSQLLDIIEARIFRVYGKGSRDIISRWINAALQKEKISVYCPEGLFDYIYAEDVAEGLQRLSESSYSGCVNLGSGKSRRISDVVEILRTHFPRLETGAVPTPNEVLYEASQADMDLFKSITGWIPTHTLENAIPQLIETQRKKVSGQNVTENSACQGILISSVSKKVPLVDAVKQAIKKHGGNFLLFGCDSNPEAIAKYALDRFWHCGLLADQTPQKLLQYCKNSGIQAILPTRDGELSYYAEHRSFFKENGIDIMVSNLNAIHICLDKLRFAEWLINHQFPAIPTALKSPNLDASSYVVKERYGAGSRAIGIQLTEQEALKHAQKLHSPIFQPYIEGTEYSIDLYRTLEGKVHGAIARRRDLVVDGESQVTTTVHKPELEDLCSQVANELNLYGHCVFQVIESLDLSANIIECNPRFGGASTASIAAGLDSFYWFLLECSGESLENYPFNRIHGNIRQVRYAVDHLFPVN